MIDILYPENDVYWIIKNEDGSIVHHGVVKPNQRLTSGLAEIVQMDNEEDYIVAVFNEGIPLSNEEDWIETPFLEGEILLGFKEN